LNILFIGAPGSGKGTQSRELINNFDFIQLSTGDLLRSAISSKSDLGMKARSYMDNGQLVPDNLIFDLVSDFLNLNKNKSIIFDGFPRTVEQAKKLNEIVALNGQKIDKVFYFKINPQILIDRLTGRRTCSKCGEIFHIHTKPSLKGDKCDKCDGNLEQRKDDHADVISERLRQFENNTSPTIDFYTKAGNVVVVNGELPPENVFNEIKKSLKI